MVRDRNFNSELPCSIASVTAYFEHNWIPGGSLCPEIAQRDTAWAYSQALRLRCLYCLFDNNMAEEKERFLGLEPVQKFLPSVRLKSWNNLVLGHRIGQE